MTDDRETTDRRIHVETHIDIAEDWSDGAFWGYMQEHGIEPEEVAEYYAHKKTESEASNP